MYLTKRNEVKLLERSPDAIINNKEKYWRQLHKTAASNIGQVMEAAPYKAAVLRPLTTHHENYQS